MSKAFTKETDTENDDEPDEPEALPKHAKNYMTPTGFTALQDEFKRLVREERPKIVETVAWAASNGDRSENGDYLYGKKRLREIDRRARYLSKRLESAEVVDPAQQQSLKQVFFGATVTYLREDETEHTVTIVGVDEADMAQGKVSWISPVARALMKAKVDDTVELRTPAGPEMIEVLKIRYIVLNNLHSPFKSVRASFTHALMDISKIPSGKNPPDDVNVIIEIPLGGSPVKYEMDKESGAMFVDRFLHTSMVYPSNYGFIPHTLSEDGDPCDVLVVGQSPVYPGAVVRSRPIGVLLMEDEAGLDNKILAVPVDKLHPFYSKVQSYEDLPEILCEQIAHFFQHYKDLEHGKWVTIVKWEGPTEAKKIIADSITAYKKSGK